MENYKFSTLEYKRPDLEARRTQLAQWKAAVQHAEDYAALRALMLEIDRETCELFTQYSIAHIRHTLDTRDEFYEAEIQYLQDTLPTLSHWSSTSSPREVVSLRTPTPMEPLTSTRGPKPACALLTSCSRAERFSLMLIRLRWLLKTPWTVSFTVMCARVLPGRTSSFAQALPALQTSKQARATAAGIHFFRSAIIPPP